MAVPSVQDNVQREINIHRTDPGRIKGQTADLESKSHRVLVVQCTIKNRLPITRGANNMIRRALADFDPVALGVDEVEAVLGVILKLPANEGVQVKLKAALLQGGFIFLCNPTHLSGKGIDGLE